MKVCPTTPIDIHVAATRQEAGVAANLIAAAFSTLPACQWLVPDPRQRYSILRSVVTITVRRALAEGRVYLATETAAASVHAARTGLGAAVWFPTTSAAPAPEGYPHQLKIAAGQYTERFLAVESVLRDHHPTGQHDSLAVLAVTPSHQGSGIGGALLATHHQHLDTAGRPAYLATADPRSCGLFERHGYLLGQPFPFIQGAKFYPMWREPRPHPTTHRDEHDGRGI